MFFNHKVEQLKYKTEVYIIWAWVSGAFSIGAVYKYFETGWPGSLVIAGVLFVLTIMLIRLAKNIKQEFIRIDTQELEQEKKEEQEEQDKLESEQKKILAAKNRKKRITAISKQKAEEREFLKEIKSRSLEENIKLLDIKYKSLPSKERMVCYGEYKESIRWLKSKYKEDS